MRGWVGVNLAAKVSFLEEMRALLAGTKIHLFEIWCHDLDFCRGYAVSAQNKHSKQSKSGTMHWMLVLYAESKRSLDLGQVINSALLKI